MTLTSGKKQPVKLIEIIDDNNKPVAVLPKDTVHRQLLMHRSVQVLVFDQQKKIYLHKRHSEKRFFPGRWDVSARTHPRVGESSIDAATRTIYAKLNLEVDNLLFLKRIPACAETGYENITIYSLMNTHSIHPNNNEVTEGYYFSREELTCLIKEFRELLTPNLVTLWEAGMLSL